MRKNVNEIPMPTPLLEKYKQDITKIILGQESTSSSQDSNRSTASVHMEVLEKRILEDS